MAEANPPSAARPPASELFLAFLAIGLSGFGGVLPFARRTLVERRGWLSSESFNEALALCQSLPGPNIINLSVIVGARFAGVAGAVAAVAGLTLAPVALVIVLGLLYDRVALQPRVAGAVAGLGAAAAGLVTTTAAKMAGPLVRARPYATVPMIAAAFIAVGLARAPLPWVMAILAPASVALAWKSSRRTDA